MNQVVLGEERVIGGAERDEPVPLGVEPEQGGGGAERGGEAGGAHGGARGGAADDVDVPEGGDCGRGPRDGGGELEALGLGRVRGEVEQVLVPGVVACGRPRGRPRAGTRRTGARRPRGARRRAAGGARRARRRPSSPRAPRGRA